MTDDIDKLAEAQRAAWGRKPPHNAKRIAEIQRRYAEGVPAVKSTAARKRIAKKKGHGELISEGRRQSRIAKTECPAWVPSHMTAEWARVLREKDEFAAAAHIRALKARESVR